MGELIDEDFFKKREQALQQQVKGQRWLTVLMVILLVVVVLGVLWWRMKNNPDTMIVDINKASMEQLQYLPEVGPVTAQDIVNGRPYESVEDLKKVRGIGEKTFQKIRPRVKLE
ncbi:ComEA family DNA-binding protein [Phragmitibacter flavus]|nr:helix-hairpin-helix domain-containing protein [Phragmitibacter flavus]